MRRRKLELAETRKEKVKQLRILLLSLDSIEVVYFCLNISVSKKWFLPFCAKIPNYGQYCHYVRRFARVGHICTILKT